MDINNIRYSAFGLCRDMRRTPDVIAGFDMNDVEPFVEIVRKTGKLLVAGEGSSRIFPGKRLASRAMAGKGKIVVATESSLQMSEYDLKDSVLFGVSNSGRTSELVQLFVKASGAQGTTLFGLTAFEDSLISSLAERTHVLHCGKEQAVAATISVVEQALFLEMLWSRVNGRPNPDLNELAQAFADTLDRPVPEDFASKLTQAGMVYWAGRNNGVAEELRLKTNEIVRKRSDFLEGTYAVHGVEEVMQSGDVMVLIDPFPGEENRFMEYLVKGAGIQIIAIADHPTLFPTFVIPSSTEFSPYLQLAAGWNLLTECGLKAGLDLDHPSRARKIGNEYQTNQLNQQHGK